MRLCLEPAPCSFLVIQTAAYSFNQNNLLFFFPLCFNILLHCFNSVFIFSVCSLLSCKMHWIDFECEIHYINKLAMPCLYRTRSPYLQESSLAQWMCQFGSKWGFLVVWAECLGWYTCILTQADVRCRSLCSFNKVVGCSFKNTPVSGVKTILEN